MATLNKKGWIIPIPLPKSDYKPTLKERILGAVGGILIACLIFLILLYGGEKGVWVYDAFIVVVVIFVIFLWFVSPISNVEKSKKKRKK